MRLEYCRFAGHRIYYYRMTQELFGRRIMAWASATPELMEIPFGRKLIADDLREGRKRIRITIARTLRRHARAHRRAAT